MTQNKKCVNYQIMDRIENYNFYVDQVNIHGIIKIKIFKI